MSDNITSGSVRSWFKRERVSTWQGPSDNRKSRSEKAGSQYNLNDACRIRTMVADSSASLRCPTCGASLGGVAGGSRDRKVWLLICHGCGRGLVLSDST